MGRTSRVTAASGASFHGRLKRRYIYVYLSKIRVSSARLQHVSRTRHGIRNRDARSNVLTLETPASGAGVSRFACKSISWPPGRRHIRLGLRTPASGSRGGLSPRAHSDKTPSKPRYRLTPTLSDPRTATRIDACARSFHVRLYRSARVAPTRSAAIGTEVQRFLEARRKRLAQNHHR